MELLVQHDYLETLLQNLQQDQQPLWGQMTPQHMIEHLSGTLAISHGKIKLPPPELSAEKLAEKKAWLMDPEKHFKPNTKSARMPDKPMPLRFKDLDQAKDVFFTHLAAFHGHFKGTPHILVTHPVFGPLNYEEWLAFFEKHHRHHFAQFGLVQGTEA